MVSRDGRRAAREAGTAPPETIPTYAPTPLAPAGGAVTVQQAATLMSRLMHGGLPDVPEEFAPEGADEFDQYDGTYDRYQGMEYADLVRTIKALERRVAFYAELEAKRSRATAELEGEVTLVGEGERATLSVVTAGHLEKRDTAFTAYLEALRREEREYLDERLDAQDEKIDAARSELVALVPLMNSLIASMAGKPKATPRPRTKKGTTNVPPTP